MGHEAIVQIILGAFGSALLIIFNRISHDIGRLTTSVESLNSKMATVVTKVDSHEKRLDRLEKHNSRV